MIWKERGVGDNLYVVVTAELEQFYIVVKPLIIFHLAVSMRLVI
jgi:hypothetical protein